MFFRRSTFDEANRLGLKGTVQNLPDGSVEIHAEGDDEKLRDLLAWCQGGPELAQVNHAQATEEKIQNYNDFIVI